MDLEDLKSWHWAIGGLIAGLLVSYAWTSPGPQRESFSRQPITADVFVEKLAANQIRDLQIEPPTRGQNYVRGEILTNDRWTRFSMYAQIPFDARNVHAASVVEHVRSMGAPMRFPWWRARWFVISASSLAGVFLVGGVWPVALRVSRGGPIFPPRLVEEKYDFSQFEHAPEKIEKIVEPYEAPDVEIELPAVESPAAENPPGTVKPLAGEKLEPSAPQPEEHKEYRGEFYPVEKPHGFSLVELLVVIAIIAILIAFMIPTITAARQSASVTTCANNLRQISVALQSYLNDNQLMCFWRGASLDRDGMDWCGFGGRPTGNANLSESNYFNRVSRPLNRYVGDKLEIFRCPNDDSAPWTLDLSYTIFAANSQFDWVGNSYHFNANGYPLRPLPRRDGGLDGIRFTSISDSSHTIVFFDACLFWGADWHHSHKGNFAFADGHVEFLAMPSSIGTHRWNP